MKTRWCLVAAMMMWVVSACAQPPPSGTIEYSMLFERGIPAGQTLPGTNLKYVGKTEQGAQMTIGGQPALKRALDSLTWRGDVAPGVNVDYSLRIITFDANSLQAGGTAKVALSNAKPKAVPVTSLPKDALTFKGAVSYSVPKGTTVPGTTITYDGKTPDGAKLGGIEGYAYRQAADSIVWTGQLTDKVFLELDLRLVAFDDNAMQVTGTATLYIKA